MECIGETLLVKREIGNVYDPNAVAVYQEVRVVGHVPVPRNLAPRVFHF